MSEQNPYQKLGVTEDASFEEIQDAKQRLTQQHQNDSKVVESIEAAYDSIIMERLRMRQEGKIKVPDRIRYPEKTVETPPSFPSLSMNNSPGWLQQIIDTPSTGDIIWSAAIFLTLSGITVFAQGLDSSNISLLITLGVCGNIYLLYRKENRFVRALLISFAGLLVGVGLGLALANVVMIDLLPEQFATVVTFCLFWLISSFLR